MEPFVTWGLELIRALQSLGGWLKPPMEFFTFLGTEEFFLLLLPLAYWCLSKRLGRELTLLLIVSNGANSLFKGLFKMPRPYWLDATLGLSAEESFGLPSGHAMSATLMWGYLAVLARGALRWLLLAVILLISVSRLYLGVHFPADVLTGWLLGAALLALYLRWRPGATAWLLRQTLPVHVGLATGAALAILALYALAYAVPAGDPQRYGALYTVAMAQMAETGGTVAGMLWGLWVGVALELRHVRFVVGGPAWQRALRYAVGMVGVIILWLGLKAIFPTEPAALGLALRIVRYAAMAFWTTVGWPWLFIKIGLGAAEPARAGISGAH